MLCKADTMKARTKPTGPIDKMRNRYMPTKISTAIPGILNSGRLPVHLKTRMAAPTETVIAKRVKTAVIAVVIFSSFAVNRTKKGKTSWKGNLKVFDSNTIAVHAIAIRKVARSRPGKGLSSAHRARHRLICCCFVAAEYFATLSNMELLSVTGLGVSFDRSHCSRAGAKYRRVRILNYDTHWKSLSDPHPVEIALNKWHSLNCTVIVLRLYRGRNSFHLS